jgi:hypothetical protein
MTERPAHERLDDRPIWFEIRVGTALDAHWATWFDGMRLTVLDDRMTRIVGPVLDDAALHGILGRIADLGLPLVLVRRLQPEEADSQDRSERRCRSGGPARS